MVTIGDRALRFGGLIKDSIDGVLCERIQPKVGVLCERCLKYARPGSLGKPAKFAFLREGCSKRVQNVLQMIYKTQNVDLSQNVFLSNLQQ